MKELPISRGRVSLVDDEDYDDLIRYRWCTTTRGYVMRRTKKDENLGGICIYLHRHLMRTQLLDNQELEVDHKDHNPLNNQKSNLRIANRGESCRNTRLSKHSRTGFKGVTKLGENNYRSRIKLNSRYILLGRFKTAIEAAIAYNIGAIKHHGEFACLNQIPEGVAIIPVNLMAPIQTPLPTPR